MGSQELRIIKSKLNDVLKSVYEHLAVDQNVNNRTIDRKVLSKLKGCLIDQEELIMKFSDPHDRIYSAESGRTPYDVLCHGKISGRPFQIFLNNKYGNLKSSAKNDVTTYNNLLRLYLAIDVQRLKKEVILNREKIHKRITGDEIVGYGIFIMDASRRGYNFFLLEEIKDEFYVNPRNNMFQVKYSPELLSEPMEFYDFVMKLIDATLEGLRRSINITKTEILTIEGIRHQLMEFKRSGGEN